MSSLNAAFVRTSKPSFPALTSPKEFHQFREKLRRKIQDLIRYEEVDAPLNLQNRGSQDFQGYRVEYVTYDTEPDITLPALFFSPTQPPSERKRPILYLSDGSKSEDAATEIKALVEAGHTVLSPDVRGKGETSRSGEDDESFADWFSSDYQIAMMALQLGRPLVGMRVLDIVKSLSALENLSGRNSKGIIAVGKGSGTIPLLHAAALDQRVETIILEKGLVSWTNMVESPYHRAQLDNVIQGALLAYDLPYLAALIAPRTLILGNLINAVGHLMKLDEVAQQYLCAQKCYELLGQPKQLNIVERREDISIVETYGNYLLGK